MPKLAKTTSTISFWYPKKKVSYEFDWLHAYKHESFLQIDTMIFDEDGQASPKVPKIASLQYLCNILKNKLEMKLIFYMQINIKISRKLITTL